jgi:hypothetical protein
MASEGFYNPNTGEGYSEFIAQQKSAFDNQIKYENSEEFKTKMQEELNRLEEYLVKNSYKRLQPGLDKLEKGKIYYIIQSINLGRRVSVYPTKVRCVEVNPDGTGNFEDVDRTSTKFNNISLDSYDGNKQKILGIWYRNPSFSTALGLGSASNYKVNYKAGKKLRKTRKTRKTRKSKKTRKIRRR